MGWNRRFDGSLQPDFGTARARPTGSAWLNFKFGLQRDVMPQSMTICLDEYRKNNFPPAHSSPPRQALPEEQRADSVEVESEMMARRKQRWAKKK